MPHLRRKYEWEVRIAIAGLIMLLMAINFASNYMLNRTQVLLTAELDDRLTSALKYATRYLINNHVLEIPDDSRRIVSAEYDLYALDTKLLTMAKIQEEEYYESIADSLESWIQVRFDSVQISALAQGEIYYLYGNQDSERIAFTSASTKPGTDIVIIARTRSIVLGMLRFAARWLLLLVSIALGFTVLLAVLLPRWILKPYVKLRETAKDSGNFVQESTTDEVSDLIESYRRTIKELKEKEAELSRLYRETATRADRLERHNQYILRSIKSGVITVDPSGVIVGFNGAAEAMLGVDRDQVLQKHFLAAFSEDDEITLQIEAGLLREQSSPSREMRKRKDDRTVWLGVESSLVYDEADDVIGVTVLLTDITELKETQARLEVNRQLVALGEMTGGLAHQLRNELAAISGFSQLLSKKTRSDPQLHELADSIRGEAKAAESLVSRFLEFARPLHLNEEWFDLGQLAADAVARRKRQEDAVTIEAVFEPTADIINYFGDRLMLRQSLDNLIDNAVQAVDQNGRVSVRVEASHGGFSISVTDDGCGIPDEVRALVFTPFYSSKPSGTGLGLALVQKIISLHGGTITLESAPGSGTAVNVFLPMRAPSESPMPAKPYHAKKV
jgi:PAS domain S-box-containing protein